MGKMNISGVRKCILVLGMHRSGTSAITRTLSFLGAELPLCVLPPAFDNTMGFWEPADMPDLHDRFLDDIGTKYDEWQSIDFSGFDKEKLKYWRREIKNLLQRQFPSASLFVLKDPRICRFVMIYFDIFNEMNVTPQIVIPFRNPLEVAKSLADRNGFTIEKSLLLWLRHTLDAERFTRGHTRVFVSFEKLIYDWRGVIININDHLDVVWPRDFDDAGADISRFLSPEFRHYVSEVAEMQNSKNWRWVADIFEVLKSLENSPIDKSCLEVFDRVYAEFEEVSSLFTPEVKHLESMLYLQRRAWQERADGMARLQNSLAKQKRLARERASRVTALENSLHEQEQVAQARASRIATLQYSLQEQEQVAKERDERISALEADVHQLQRTVAESRQYVEHTRWQASLINSEFEKSKKKSGSSRWLAKQLRKKVSQLPRDISRRLRSSLVKKYRATHSWQLIATKGYKKYITTKIILMAKPFLGGKTIKRLKRRRDKYQLYSSSELKTPYLENNIPNFQETDVLFPENAFEAINKISFRRAIKTDISVIIPTYDDIHFTARCLSSLYEQVTSYDFEVIVADDCSPSRRCDALRQVPGLEYVRNQQNLGFIRNCNSASRVAQGEYLLFLNNDTVADKLLIQSLRQTFSEHGDVGVVGAKLVYPYGQLQEAGGIVWEDASGWNWGRFQDPNHPRYNYVRDVDYVSGAALMIHRETFERLGRFDEGYNFAYYEDTDLCFAARSAGMRVLYQPYAKLIHYEGVTHGTDETSGHKKHQAENRLRFREKWASALINHLPNGASPYIACDRWSQGHVLIVDACTPTPDKDSGSIDMFNMIRIFRNLNYRVHFVPLTNLAHFGQYTEALQRMGVECVYAPYYPTLQSYLEEMGEYIDFTILSRVNVAANAINTVRRYCQKAKVIFYTVDLHFLREMRDAELSEERRKLKVAKETRRRELAVMDKTEVTIVLSDHEKAQLEALGKTNVTVIPLIRDIKPHDGPSFQERRGVLFIGGYQHPPNVDAVDWLAEEVWPAVRRLVADRGLEPIPLRLYGSNMPERFALLATDDLEPIGYVDDLADAFGNVRLSIAPLRYGAGLKGKMATSYEYGVPAVGTSIAFEGMPKEGLEEILRCADSPEALAAAIIDLYYDAQAWACVAEAGKRYVNRHYSIEAVEKRIKKLILGDKGLEPKWDQAVISS